MSRCSRGLSIAVLLCLSLASYHRADALASLPASALTPQHLRDAYQISPLLGRHIDGNGQTIAFIEIDGYAQSDLALFNRRFHLPPSMVTRYTFDGQRSVFRANGSPINPPGLETSLDLEWAHVIAPHARLLDFEIHQATLADVLNNQTSATLYDALHAAIGQHPTAISISLGAGGLACFSLLASFSLGSELQRAAQQGIAVFASSGDSGASQAQCFGAQGTSYPASDPNVTAVGGTTLLMEGGGVLSETAWGGSGGGVNHTFIRPAWQAAPGLPAALPASPGRFVPDVAFDANPSTGVPILTAGQWRQVGGTSLGSPCWAAIWALLVQAAPQFGDGSSGASPTLYALAQSPWYGRVFRDIQSGSNGQQNAGPGWDGVTGLGSPLVDALIARAASGIGWRRFDTPAPPPMATKE